MRRTATTKQAEYSKTYRLRHPEKVRAASRAYHAAHREERRAYTERYRAGHPEKVQAYRLSATTRARERALKADLYRRDRERLRVQTSEYQRTHPEVRRAKVNRYRARRAGAAGSHTKEEWLDKVTLLGGCCIYCGRDDRPLIREHNVPLSRGGTDDISNILPACQPCNEKKFNRTAREFLAARAA